MRKRDLVLAGACLAVLAALLAPALASPGRALANFGDLYAFHLPLRVLCASRLQAGQLPFWNPYIFAGVPLLADLQAATFYPGSLLFPLLPALWAFSWTVFLHLAWAALGAHLFLRKEGFSAGVAGALAAAYALSPMLVYRIAQGIPTQIVALSWVPWCWLALRAESSMLLGAAWALQALGGHPEFGAINALALIADGVRRPGGPRTLAGGAAWACALTAAQLVPALEALRSSSRAGLPAAFAGAYRAPWRALVTLIAPRALGTPLDGSFAGPPSVFFESCVFYAGLAPLAAALYAAARAETRRAAAFPLALAAAGALAATGTFGSLAMSRVPARFALWTSWGLLLAAAVGLREAARRRPAVAAAAFLLVLADLAPLAARFAQTEAPAAVAAHPEIFRAFSDKPARLATGPDLGNPNKAMLYRVMNVNGYAASLPTRYAVYAARAEGAPAADPSRTYLTRVSSPELRRLGVAGYLTSEVREGAVLAENSGVRLYANPGAFPLAYLEGPACFGEAFCSASVRLDRAESVVVSGAIPPAGMERLVLSVPEHPGWRAWLDGRPAAIALHDGLVQSISLAGVRGPFRAVFRFTPSAWPLLACVSAFAWALWFARISA
jgi:hypothetical protein